MLQNIKKFISIFDFKTFIITGLLVIILFFPRENTVTEIVEVPVKIEVPIPGKEGTSDTIYLPSPVKFVNNPVNDSLVEAYKKSNDSIQKLNLFIDAIKMREYVNIFTDSTQSVTVNTTTRGSIVSQHITYDIYPSTINIDTSVTYSPKYRSSIYLNGELGLPLLSNEIANPNVKLGVILQYKKRLYNISLDTQGYVYGGVGIKL